MLQFLKKFANLNPAEQHSISEKVNARKLPNERGSRSKPTMPRPEDEEIKKLSSEMSSVNQLPKNPAEASSDNNRKGNMGLYKITSNNTIEVEMPKSSSKKRRSRLGDIDIRNPSFNDCKEEKFEFHFSRKAVENDNKMCASPIINDTLTSRNVSKFETNISIKNLLIDHRASIDKENRQSTEFLKENFLNMAKEEETAQPDFSLMNEDKNGRKIIF